MADVRKRKAVKQADRCYDDDGDSESSSHVNIWYGSTKKRGRGKEKAATKCDVVKHSGVTRGYEAKAREFCLHFARGACCRGEDCHKLHFVPNEEDDLGLDNAVDCFGRERGRDEGSDQDGVGCLFKENRTLWVGGLPPMSSSGKEQKDMENSLFECLCAYGPLSSFRFIPKKGCVFVQYRYRACAEFAREAMANQTLSTATDSKDDDRAGAGGKDEGPVLHVKWATEDPNPRAIALDTQRKAQTLLAAKIAKREAPSDLYGAVPERDRVLLKRMKLDGQQGQQQQQQLEQQCQSQYGSYCTGAAADSYSGSTSNRLFDYTTSVSTGDAVGGGIVGAYPNTTDQYNGGMITSPYHYGTGQTNVSQQPQQHYQQQIWLPSAGPYYCYQSQYDVSGSWTHCATPSDTLQYDSTLPTSAGASSEHGSMFTPAVASHGIGASSGNSVIGMQQTDKVSEGGAQASTKRSSKTTETKDKKKDGNEEKEHVRQDATSSLSLLGTMYDSD